MRNTIKNVISFMAAAICMGTIMVSASADSFAKTPKLINDTSAECIAYAQSPALTNDTTASVSSPNGRKAPVKMDDTQSECTTTADERDIVIDDETEAECEVRAPGALLGDVNADGYVNVTDLSVLSAHVKGVKVLEDLSYADITGDGVVNVSDVARLSAILKGVAI